MHLSVYASKIAFTLAEVLITLGIIGVVAALTLPTLIQNYQKKQTVTQLKKAYSELSQAVNMAQAQHGTLDSWDLSDFESPVDRNKYFFENFLEPNLKILKKCIPTSEECFNRFATGLDGQSVDIHGTSDTSVAGTEISFITASGYSVYSWVHIQGNGAWLIVDLNGNDKKPNQLGKDIFYFVSTWGDTSKGTVADTSCRRKQGTAAYGLECQNNQIPRDKLISGNTTNINASTRGFGCSKGTGNTKSGGYCAALIMADGWEIAPDYPW